MAKLLGTCVLSTLCLTCIPTEYLVPYAYNGISQVMCSSPLTPQHGRTHNNPYVHTWRIETWMIQARTVLPLKRERAKMGGWAMGSGRLLSLPLSFIDFFCAYRTDTVFVSISNNTSDITKQTTKIFTIRQGVLYYIIYVLFKGNIPKDPTASEHKNWGHKANNYRIFPYLSFSE